MMCEIIKNVYQPLNTVIKDISGYSLPKGICSRDGRGYNLNFLFYPRVKQYAIGKKVLANQPTKGKYCDNCPLSITHNILVEYPTSWLDDS